MPAVRGLNSRDCLYWGDWPLCSTPCPLPSNINPPHPWCTWLKIRMLVWVRALYIVLNEVLIIYINDEINIQCTWKNATQNCNMNFKITKKNLNFGKISAKFHTRLKSQFYLEEWELTWPVQKTRGFVLYLGDFWIIWESWHM